MGQQVNVYSKLKFFPGATIEGWGPQGLGRTYYVNNITGSASADGLSWDTAIDELDNAITKSEAYRQMGGGYPDTRAVATNDYIRNTIVMQGTYTAYEVITSLPLHTHIIGLGDWPCGLGQGMVMIGEINKTGITEASDTIRGLDLYNLQIQGNGNTYNCMSVKSLFRSRIEDCGFIQNSGTGSTDACLNITDNMNSVLFKHNMVGITNSTGRPDIGLDLTCSGVLTNNRIEDNIIYAVTYGIRMSSGTNDNGTVIRDNIITAITDPDDELNVGITVGLYSLLVHNFISAAEPFEQQSTGQTIGNFVLDSGDGKIITELD